MPASGEMESSFYTVLPWPFKERRFAIAEFFSGRFQIAPPCSLMHASGDAVATVGLDARRATAESAENQDRGHEGE
jgi:hypothetical protein